jgi:hypothetical protein
MLKGYGPGSAVDACRSQFSVLGGIAPWPALKSVSDRGRPVTTTAAEFPCGPMGENADAGKIVVDFICYLRGTGILTYKSIEPWLSLRLRSAISASSDGNIIAIPKLTAFSCTSSTNALSLSWYSWKAAA